MRGEIQGDVAERGVRPSRHDVSHAKLQRLRDLAKVQHLQQGMQDALQAGEVHVFQRFDDERPRGRSQGRVLRDVNERTDEDLRRDEPRAPYVPVQRPDVARGLLEVLPRQLDDGAREQLAEGDDAGFFQVVDALGAGELQDLLDLLGRRFDLEGARDPDQPVQPAEEERPVQVHPQQLLENRQTVLFFLQGEQGDACLEAVLLLFRGAREERADLRDGRGPVRVAVFLEVCLHVGKHGRRGVLFQQRREHRCEEHVLVRDALQGDVVLADFPEHGVDVRRSDHREFAEQVGRCAFYFADDLFQEITDQRLGLRIDPRGNQQEAENAGREAQPSLELREGKQEGEDRLPRCFLQRFQDVVCLRVFRLLHAGQGAGQGVLQGRVAFGFDERLGGDALHGFALLGIGEHRLVQLQDLLGGGGDRVDRLEDLRPQLFFREMAEVLHQHSRR